MSQTVVLKVAMSCGGCAGAVKRVLTNLEGVETFDIDLEQKKVTVKGNVEPDLVFQTVSKTGKKTEFWPTEEASSCCGGKKSEEPVAAAPYSDQVAETVDPVAAAPSCVAGKPAVSEAAKPVEPVIAPSSEAEKPVVEPVEKPVEPVVV